MFSDDFRGNRTQLETNVQSVGSNKIFLIKFFLQIHKKNFKDSSKLTSCDKLQTRQTYFLWDEWAKHREATSNWTPYEKKEVIYP